jgi:hypothetical protein
LYAAGDLIVGDWKTLQVLAVRSQSQALDIKGGPFTVLNLRAFIAVSITISYSSNVAISTLLLIIMYYKEYKN